VQAANPATPKLLEQLHDIHGAAAPGWWPPAPGWWLLAALALLLLVVLLRLLVRRLVVWRRRRGWLQALRAVDARWDPAREPHHYLAELNRVFRAVALRAFPESTPGRLEGQAWVSFIRDHLPETPSAPALAALASGPYQPAPEFDAAALREQARAWVKRHG
jgi:Domain of unknown function (DUF4381)